MSKGYTVVATPTFKITLRKLSQFLRNKYGNEAAISCRDTIKLQLEKLSDNPLAAPISERLASLGFNEYRQLLVDQHNLVFYRVNETTKEVILILVMDSRQSIAQLLYETTLQME
ncbi:type II toxin-antitoxin system RelE/ParE family toxin [Spongiibacter sp. KMU-158]|uniref:Type II toxin-antitoxin system RelE/ParE family toxin n=1 Tax=Spongiibacter pelagi TaxID=2760804 RepID=A0A927BYJ5_9GAMM|nr:type II toxin-antitoxin system RelE/ParE family toxin [Spongiibacter pelagi]MBD2857925.1 type II toxin-antitoxin system RelE/ParE family toxin [Spongiibacter pelagi]